MDISKMDNTKDTMFSDAKLHLNGCNEAIQCFGLLKSRLNKVDGLYIFPKPSLRSHVGRDKLILLT